MERALRLAMDWFLVISGTVACAFIAIFVAAVAFVGTDWCFSTVRPDGTAIIESKIYVPSSNRVGTAFDSNNKTYTTVDYEPEKWIVVIRKGDMVHSVKCWQSQWGLVKEGQEVNVSVIQGRFITHGYRLNTEK